MRAKKITLFILLMAVFFVLIFKQLTAPDYVYMCGTFYKTDRSELDLDCDFKSCGDFRDLKFFPSLNCLSISRLRSDKELLLPDMNDLEYIRFNNCDIKDTAFFNSLTGVKEIHILETKINLSDHLNNGINSMEFIFCDINNFDKISTCSNVEKLSVYGCEFTGTNKTGTFDHEMQDSSVFSDFDNVKVLEIYATKINDISGFSDMQSLKEIHFRADDITDEQVTELENVGIKVYLHEPKY